MLPLWWTFGNWDYIEKQDVEMKNQTFKQVVSTATKPQSIPAALNSIQTIPQKPCWRRCYQRINKIVYRKSTWYIIGHMAKLAGYLCATVEFPKQHSMLMVQDCFNQYSVLPPYTTHLKILEFALARGLTYECILRTKV
jgi:hypothetical protein